MNKRTGHVVALCGGVGGAKLAFGLVGALAPDALTLVVNTGDDMQHLGLHVSPDIDTVIYTLAGLSDRERGWGLAGETWGFMGALARVGGETWFQLGDRDLAMHVERSRRLGAGESLSWITHDLAIALGVSYAVVPMSNDAVRTIVRTAGGDLPFQRYFVEQRCRPTALGIRFDGADDARPSPGFAAALRRSDVDAVVICPSNPYLSVDPILAVPGVRESLRALGAPIVAVSPIIGGQALKGPAAKLMAEFGVTPGVAAVADHYGGFIDGLVIDEADRGEVERLRADGLAVLTTRTVMTSDEDRYRLARETLDFADAIGRPRRRLRRAS